MQVCMHTVCVAVTGAVYVFNYGVYHCLFNCVSLRRLQLLLLAAIAVCSCMLLLAAITVYSGNT